jgi:divalent metal cation (Fe/Co/Zn/Cd) transporter
MMQTLPEVTAPDPGFEYVELQHLIFWTLWSLVLLIGISMVVQFMAGSLTLGAVLIDSATSLLLHIFNTVSIGVILRQNPFSHPYGTGKLENFAGFLYAMLAIPGSLWILFSAYSSFMQPPPTANLGLATLAILLSVIRSVWLLRRVQRMAQRYAHPSPLTTSYLVNLRVSSVTDLTLLIGVFIGFGFSLTRHADLALDFDVAIASLQGFYLLYSAIQVLLANFKSLIDMPLPEADQLKILQALSAHFDAFEDIGNVYTQLSGSTRLVQIELYVKPDTTAEAIGSLSADMHNCLKVHFGKLVFHLIPLVRQEAA